MLPLAADENFNHDVVRAVRRCVPDIDFLTVQEAGLAGKEDPVILEWVAREDRVLFTHDVETMAGFAYERIQVGLPMPGLFEVAKKQRMQAVIEDIILIAECSFPGEWANQIHFLPFK